MMGICTTLIGVLPTYAQVGILRRVAGDFTYYPGLGAGAEISGAGTMLAEYAPKGKRGIISSLVAMGTNCGTLSATAIWAIMFSFLTVKSWWHGMANPVPGQRSGDDIRYLAASEP